MSFFKKDSKNGMDYIQQKYGADIKPVSSSNPVEYLFSVYDKICEEYNPPFVCKNMATAIRNMKDSLKDAKQSIIAMHPEDYVLVQIGTFDKDTGMILHDNSLVWESYELSKLFTPLQEEIKDDEIQNK